MQNQPVEDHLPGGEVSESGQAARIRMLENKVAALQARLQEQEAQNRFMANDLAPTLREGLMNRVLDILPVGVWLTDREGKITLVNLAAQIIWSGAKMVGVEQYYEFKGWWLETGEPVQPREWPMIRAVQFGETWLNQEIEIESFDGRRKMVSSSAIPIFSRGQEVNGAIVVFEDITARKKAEIALKQANQDLERRVRERTIALERSNKNLQEFAFVASHDLQEPLRKVMTFGKLLLDYSNDRLSPTEREYLMRMTNAAERMSQMLHALLNYSRLNTQAQPYKLVDLNEVVTEVLSDLEINLADTGGVVKVGKLPTIEAEPVQIRQLLQNLISNALKFHKPDVPPQVKIYQLANQEDYPPDSDQPEERVTVVIEDNGIGFDNANKSRLFEPFHRLVGRFEFEGTGIGLSICRKIVEAHGGTIDASGFPGAGAKFTVQLPLRQPSGESH